MAMFCYADTQIFVHCAIALKVLLFIVPTIVHSFSMPSFLPPRTKQLYMVSELHIPGYAQTKLPFILSEDERKHLNTNAIQHDTVIPTIGHLPLDPSNYLIHQTVQPIFAPSECEQIIQEAEYVASQIVPWTTNRHGNYPTYYRITECVALF
jgi:hypothetical protein